MSEHTYSLSALKYHLVRPGVSLVEIRTRSRRGWRGPRFDVTSRSDALGDLARTVIALLEGSEHAEFVCYGGLGFQQTLRFQRSGDMLRLAIHFYNPPRRHKTTEVPDRGPQVYEATLLHVAKLVRHELKAVLDTWGIEGYREMWPTHPFPLKEYHTLDRLIEGH